MGITKIIILSILLLVLGIWMGIGYIHSGCPDGYWSPVNHCSTLCEGHNHTINITFYPNGKYNCMCPEGQTGMLNPVCV